MIVSSGIFVRYHGRYSASGVYSITIVAAARSYWGSEKKKKKYQPMYCKLYLFTFQSHQSSKITQLVIPDHRREVVVIEFGFLCWRHEGQEGIGEKLR